jgi:phage shock protein PspC (stress-responsive transcriptional regulator)
MGTARLSTAKLSRSETDKMIAGIAGGIAAHYGLDSTLVRVLWVVALLMGWGFFAYLILWIVLPKGPASTSAIRLAEERYAQGEISAGELRRTRDELEGKS